MSDFKAPSGIAAAQVETWPVQVLQPPYSVIRFPTLRLPWPRKSPKATTLLRQQLIEALGLKYDPLITSVSESDPAASFGEVYVDRRPSLLDTLQWETGTLVFAHYGMGKTATRRALEFLLRNSFEDAPALCVTYRPRISRWAFGSRQRLLNQHLAAVAAEISVDLIIQLIERLDDGAWRFSDQPVSRLPEQGDDSVWRFSDQHAAALRRHVRALPLAFRRAIIAAAQSPTPEDGVVWDGARAVARYVAVTPQWRALIKRLASFADRSTPRPVTWEQTQADVRTLGFPRIFLLVDAVDEGNIDRSALRALVEPLLEMVGDLQGRQIFLKCFLPADLEHLFVGPESLIQGLTLVPEIANITRASPDHLEAIVNERLQAACRSNAGFRNLDWLKGADIHESIPGRLARMAQGSPRAMIELASQLLDFHSRQGFKSERRLRLTAEEWKAFLQQLERTAPAPS